MQNSEVERDGESRERMDEREQREQAAAMQRFLQDDGGTTVSAESKEQAIEAVIRKIQADPDVSVRSLLLHDASEAHALKILTLFSKTHEDLIEAFVAFSAVRAPLKEEEDKEQGETTKDDECAEAWGRATQALSDVDIDGKVIGYDCDKAFQRLRLYISIMHTHEQLLLFDDPPLCPSTIQKVEQVLRRTVIVMDPTAVHGGVVVLFALARFEYDKLIETQGIMSSFSRYLLFMLHSLMFDADAQRHGIIGLNDYNAFDLTFFLGSRPRPLMTQRARTRRAVMLKLLTQAMPLRFKGMYAINLPWWIHHPARIATALLPAKLKKKVHFGHWEGIYSEVVGASHLPVEHGGAPDQPSLDDLRCDRYQGYLDALARGFQRCKGKWFTESRPYQLPENCAGPASACAAHAGEESGGAAQTGGGGAVGVGGAGREKGRRARIAAVIGPRDEDDEGRKPGSQGSGDHSREVLQTEEAAISAETRASWGRDRTWGGAATSKEEEQKEVEARGPSLAGPVIGEDGERGTVSGEDGENGTSPGWFAAVARWLSLPTRAPSPPSPPSPPSQHSTPPSPRFVDDGGCEGLGMWGRGKRGEKPDHTALSDS